ncbi:hypothetical protein ACFV6U_26705, partial [Streptomyces sp. NPDC059810]
MQSHETFPSTDIPHAASQRPGRNEAEAALVEHYPRLVRLAHLILPPSLGRHRRVLAAHALVQKSLSSAAPVRLALAGVGATVAAARGGAGAVRAWGRRAV